MQTKENLTPPKTTGEWTLSQIQAALSRPLPESMIEVKTLKGSRIPYIPWYTVNRILDKYAPGWIWEICKMGMSADRLFLVGRLTIPTAEGNLYREATGTEELKRTNDDGDSVELAYGDPSSNAESMAFRRAAARFGLGLYLSLFIDSGEMKSETLIFRWQFSQWTGHEAGKMVVSNIIWRK